MAFTLQENLGSAPDDHDTYCTGGTNKYWSFGWTASSGYTLTQASLLLYRVGSPTAVLTCYIFADSAGQPGTLLATSTGTVASSTLTTSTAGAYVDFPFAGQAIVNATRYHMASSGSTQVDASNAPVWRYLGSGAGSEEADFSSAGSVWTTDETLLQGSFKTWITTGGAPDFAGATARVGSGSALVITGGRRLHYEPRRLISAPRRIVRPTMRAINACNASR